MLELTRRTPIGVRSVGEWVGVGKLHSHLVSEVFCEQKLVTGAKCHFSNQIDEWRRETCINFCHHLKLS